MILILDTCSMDHKNNLACDRQPKNGTAQFLLTVILIMLVRWNICLFNYYIECFIKYTETLFFLGNYQLYQILRCATGPLSFLTAGLHRPDSFYPSPISSV